MDHNEAKVMYNIGYENISDIKEYSELILDIDSNASFHIPYTEDLSEDTYSNISSDKERKGYRHYAKKIRQAGYKYYLLDVTL